MAAWYDWLVQIHREQPHLGKALLAGTLVSTVCGVVGCFIILRRMAFLADALAHSMLAGVVCGYLLMKLVFGHEANAPAMVVGSLIAGLVTVGLVNFVSRASRVKEDTVIGIVYTGIFAIGGVLLSLFSKHVHIDLVHFLTGQLLAVQNGDLWMMAGVAAGVLALVVLLYRPLQLISFDRVMAASIGIPVAALDYLLTTCASLVVVSGVNVVGVILVVGLLIIPAATAYLLCDRLHRMLFLAALLGWTSFLGGYLASETLNVAPGSAVVVASVLQFLVVFVVAPRYGLLADWIRRRRAVPQDLLEDVLGMILRDERDWLPAVEVRSKVEGPADKIERALRALVRSGHVERAESRVRLTPQGRDAAYKLVRAHRLWETYLEQVGTPLEQLHPRAHRLEHMHEREVVDYLDDKLGHPLRDPHGAEIPADEEQLVPGAELKVALLREGHRGLVLDVAEAARVTPVQPGMRLVVGPRQSDGRLWTLMLADGRLVTVDHVMADAITVRLQATSANAS